MNRPFAPALGLSVGLALAQIACNGSVQIGSDATDAGKLGAPCVGDSCPPTTVPASGATPTVGAGSTGRPMTTLFSGSATSGGEQTTVPPSSASAGTCVPETCAQANKTGMCGGIFPDGCGGFVNCNALCGSAASSTSTTTSSGGCGDGVCSGGETCSSCPRDCGACASSSSRPITCPGPPDGGDCTPKTCAATGVTCGVVCDDCGGIIDCGKCPDAGSASSGSTSEGCDCCPATCAQLGVTCGPAGDGCGGLLLCGDYGTWTTTTLHGGATPCVISDRNGLYSQCNDGSAIGTIVLAPGAELQNATIRIIGETEGATASLTGDVSGPGGVGSADTGTVVSTNNTQASSTPSGYLIADPSSGTTVTVDVIQSFSPNNAPGIIQFEVSYQTRSCTSGSTTTSGAASDAGSSAGCDPVTCASQGVLCGNVPDGCGGVLDCGACPDSGTTSSG